ncbi:MAG TPA: nickel pincer cofactor biosynthesis protein LarC, partial [Candidatus Acidoferrales bacterium]|nr:nickel pincer cofactor biosynthesis protein LarC [Candidatus Acidoferrales bacterium]
GLAATRVQVKTSEQHHHRSLSTILDLIGKSGLTPRVTERASRIFRRLGEAEARIHNVPVEKVHFHEVGAVDAILDIVGACIGFELLGAEEFVCSPLNLGGGRVETQHGVLPVPAPATAELLLGAPTYSSGIARELVTPTGAAIVTTLCSQFGPLPPMRVGAIGYGAGTAELAEQPNVLRWFLGQAAERSAGAPIADEVTVIEANLDDMNPQIYGYFVERALGAGALDVFATPVQMKKNRPGQLLTVLCEPAVADGLVELIFRETTTIGVRTYAACRKTLERESVLVETPLGVIRVKVASLDGRVLNAAPEYDDCRRIAVEKNLPLKQVLVEAVLEFQKQRGGSG